MVTLHIVVLTILAVVSVSCGHEYNGHNLYDLQTNEMHKSKRINSTVPCRTGEQFCNVGCEEVVLCLANSELYILENCTESWDTPTCDSASLTCKASNEAKCVDHPKDERFPCHAVGVFPDPYDCNSYFVCSQAEGFGVPHSCDKNDIYGYGYDPYTTLCKLTLASRSCRQGPVYGCTVLGQSGAQPENPNIYYVCVEDHKTGNLVPWLFRCSKGYEVYSNYYQTCIFPDSSTAATTSSSTTWYTTTYTPTTSTPSTTRTSTWPTTTWPTTTSTPYDTSTGTWPTTTWYTTTYSPTTSTPSTTRTSTWPTTTWPYTTSTGTWPTSTSRASNWDPDTDNTDRTDIRGNPYTTTDRTSTTGYPNTNAPVRPSGIQ